MHMRGTMNSALKKLYIVMLTDYYISKDIKQAGNKIEIKAIRPWVCTTWTYYIETKGLSYTVEWRYTVDEPSY